MLITKGKTVIRYEYYYKYFALAAFGCAETFWANLSVKCKMEIFLPPSRRPGGQNQTHSPAPNITDGLLVLVQLVMAAMTTEP